MIAELWDNTEDVCLTICSIGGGDCNLTLVSGNEELSIEVGIDELCAAAAAVLTETETRKVLLNRKG